MINRAYISSNHNNFVLNNLTPEHKIKDIFKHFEGREDEVFEWFLFDHDYLCSIYDDPNSKKMLKQYQSLHYEKNIPVMVRPHELCNLISALKSVEKCLGDIAEVGVAAGGTAYILSEFIGDKNFFLFDTFEGLPELSEKDNRYKKGLYGFVYDDVKKLFEDYNNVQIYKGFFPSDTGMYIENKHFAFVHLDCDIYQSTYESIDFFYSRMIKGGIIISHDYRVNSNSNVELAFKEFFHDKEEKPLYLPGTKQVIVYKL